MDEGVITLTCTIASVINVWFYVFNIIEKKKNSKWNFFLHNVIFNVLVYTF